MITGTAEQTLEPVAQTVQAFRDLIQCDPEPEPGPGDIG